MTDIDINSMAFWFPSLENAGLPVPKTRFVSMCPKAQYQACIAISGDPFDEEPVELAAFFKTLTDAAKDIGFPAFLRTGHTSGKHNWEHTCHLTSADDVPKNVCGIVEYSELASMFGLPYDLWAVRELLPTKTYGHCPAYGNMPFAREFRVFIKNHEVQCLHPYWPVEALKQGRAIHTDLEAMNSLHDIDAIRDLANRAAKHFDGYWSVDILDTMNGYYIIDMADGHMSYHMENCEHNTEA